MRKREERLNKCFGEFFKIIEKAGEHLKENHFNFSSSDYFKVPLLKDKKEENEEEGNEEKGDEKEGKEEEGEEEEEEEEEEIDEKEKEGNKEVKEMWKFVFWNKLLFS